MPHKHKRARDANEEADYDLPPTASAKPLPVRTNTVFTKQEKKPNKKRKVADGYAQDDTPKAFARLMQLQSGGTRRDGLDDGSAPRGQKKKKDQQKSDQSTKKAQQDKPDLPTILPGEHMSDFRARVDHALPVSGLIGKGKKVEGIKEHTTKHNKRLQARIANARKDMALTQERRDEERELAEEEEEEQKLLYDDKTAEISNGKKGKRKKMLGEQDDGEADPWAVLKERREAPAGFNDVAQAPPQFTAIPKEKFKVRNGARVDVHDIPNAAGSLRRREELGATRKDIIESYRNLMKNKRAGE